jgi:hypothetical protein
VEQEVPTLPEQDPELEQVQKCVGVKKVKVYILNIFTK